MIRIRTTYCNHQIYRFSYVHFHLKCVYFLTKMSHFFGVLDDQPLIYSNLFNRPKFQRGSISNRAPRGGNTPRYPPSTSMLSIHILLQDLSMISWIMNHESNQCISRENNFTTIVEIVEKSSWMNLRIPNQHRLVTNW